MSVQLSILIFKWVKVNTNFIKT